MNDGAMIPWMVLAGGGAGQRRLISVLNGMDGWRTEWFCWMGDETG